MNVKRDLQKAMQDCSMAGELDLVSSNPKNFVSSYVDGSEYEYDKFSGFEKRIRKFEQDLKIFEKESKTLFTRRFSMIFTICCWRKKRPLISVEISRNLIKS